MTGNQHEADLDRVEGQNSVTDFVRGVEDGPQGGLFNRMIRSAVGATVFGQAVGRRTDFADHDLDLNKMLDLVDQTDPEDLESSGKALWDARDAIKSAADELDGHIDKVHWVGESGDAFRTWGGELVANTHLLSDFAGAAGDQITAAAVGLASVRGAMPSRDTNPSRKRPTQFTEAEKVADKEQYAAAVKVEKDRQEAINQMNRLASYYAVSEEVLAGLPAKDKTPKFTNMPDVGVPQPAKVYRAEPPGSGTSYRESTGSVPVGEHHSTVTDEAARRGTSDSPRDTTGKIPPLDEPVRTNIDSVNTLLPTTNQVTGPTPPAMGTPVPNGGQPHMYEGGLGTPMPNAAQGRNVGGTNGLRTPASAQGRPNAPGLTNQGSGRTPGQGPMNQMGRATSTGQSVGKSPVSGAQSSQMGRGISGGTPRAGGTATPRTNTAPTTGAGRSNGVVGGRPATGDASAKGGGSRIPRGTVVGGEGASSSRSVTGRPGQRGVFGTPDPTARPASGAAAARPGTGGSDPVTGRATGRNSAAGAERNGMTRGGAGLARGAGHNGKPDDDDTQATPRPDYVVEDQETHLPNQPRRDVPPVVN